MSLQVVIPSYLSRIESALTGKKARLFDYDKGVFTLKDDAEKRFTNQRKQYARSATSDVRGDVEKQLSVFGFNYDTQKKLSLMTRFINMVGKMEKRWIRISDTLEGEYSRNMKKK